MAFEPFDLGRVYQTAETIKAMQRQPEDDALRRQYMQTQIAGAQQSQKFAAQDQQAQMDAREAVRHYYANQAVENSDDPIQAALQLMPDTVQKFEAAHGPGSFAQLQPDQVKKLAAYAREQAGAVAGIHPKAKTVDAGGQIVTIDENTGQPMRGVAPIAKTVSPDSQLSSATTVRGQDLSARTTMRGQDMTAQTARMNAAQTQTTQNQNVIGKLRDDYTQTVKSTGWADQQGFYQRLKSVANDKTGASDLALVFSYMKVLDPTSAVREGEYANAKNTTGVPGSIIALYNKAVDGQILSPQQRENFVKTSDKIYAEGFKRQEAIKKDFTSKAERAGLNPQDVIVDFGAPQPGGPAKITSDADYAKIPSGTQYIAPDGSTRTKR